MSPAIHRRPFRSSHQAATPSAASTSSLVIVELAMNCTLASCVAMLVLLPLTLAPKSNAMASPPQDQREREDAAADDEPHAGAAAADRGERVPWRRIDRRDPRARHGDRRLRLLIGDVGVAGR